jgi:predicted O-methyltransferase YrrM
MKVTPLFYRLPAGLRLHRLFRAIWTELTFPQSCAPGHFYSPIPAREDVERHSARVLSNVCVPLPEIELFEQAQFSLLERLSKHAMTWASAANDRFRIENDYLPQADAIVLAAMLLEAKPQRYIEIGSGFSSALVLDVRDRFLDGKLHCTFIEPDAERLQSLLRPADTESCDVLKRRVQDVDDEVFGMLDSGDVLFVDGSHVSKVGSDLNDVLFRVLPLVAPGVRIHFHDVYWPFEYRREDLLRGRSWNEMYILRAFLANSAIYRIHLFGSWLEQCHADKWFSAFPQARTTMASSLWLVKAGESQLS